MVSRGGGRWQGVGLREGTGKITCLKVPLTLRILRESFFRIESTMCWWYIVTNCYTSSTVL